MPPVASPPPDPPSSPRRRTPAGAADCHVHLVASPEEFPLWEGRPEDPAPGDFASWLGRFERVRAALGIERAVVVHSIFYGLDPAITEAAVAAIGRSRCRGVGLAPDDASEGLLDRLAAAGIVAVRLNATLKRGVMTFEGLKAMAPRLAARGMHAQILVHAGPQLLDLVDEIRALPVAVTLDHTGWPDISRGVDDPGFAALLRLVGDGDAWVKIGGAYRMCGPPYDALDPFVRALLRANPERCLWGSDWPHLMLDGAPTPDAGALLDAFMRAADDDALIRRVLTENPAALYGFGP